MYKILRRKVRLLKRDEKGQFGVVFALLALPLIGITTLAVDHSFAYKEKLKLQNALDDTALASVLDQTLSETERAEFATNFFGKFFPETDDVDFQVLDSGASRVSLTAETKVPTTFASIFGKESLTVSENAAAEITSGSVICMLTLEPEDRGSFIVTHGSEFNSPTCSVQVNSTHGAALSVHNGGKMIAKDICVSGGAVGTQHTDAYTPFANTECGVVPDPYQHTRIPEPGPCQAPEILAAKFDDWMSEVFYPTEFWNGFELVTSEGGVTLEPGTYCGGLDLTARHVRFAPGEYFIKDGSLNIASGAKVSGDGVTFIFSGLDANLIVGDGSIVEFTAPATGDLKGLVFAQHLETQHGVDAELPSAESIITSGGNVNIIGTAYLPTHQITFNEGSIGAAQAPATSFISYRIKIDNGAKISVAVDHQTAGLPPILPRSDESARLVE